MDYHLFQTGKVGAILSRCLQYAHGTTTIDLVILEPVGETRP